MKKKKINKVKRVGDQCLVEEGLKGVIFMSRIENMHLITLCTARGSNANICDDRLLRELQTKGMQMEVAHLKRLK